MRAAVVIVENGRVALIERVRDPHEELGVSVELGDLISVAYRDGREQRYYLASIVGGTFGMGHGREMITSGTTAKGTYRPVWVDLTILPELDVRPRALSEALASWTGDGEIRWIGEYK